MIVATMQLIEAGPDKVLCGFDDDETSVFVLRKQTATEYALHQIPISDASQAFKAIFAASEREGETLRHLGRDSVLRDLRYSLDWPDGTQVTRKPQ